jgi:hypothetical protein
MVSWSSPRPDLANAAPSDRYPSEKPWWLVPSLLLFIYLAQCSWFIRTQSLTYDEPVHIAEGLDAWRHGRFEQYNDQPPLSRLLLSLPLIADKWQVEVQPGVEGFRIPRVAPDPVEVANRSRRVNNMLGLLLGLLLWLACRQLISQGAGNVALALFVFSPSLIAHFSLATTDGAATLLIFAAAWQLVRWRHTPTWAQTLLLAIVLGLMLLAKFSTAVMFVLALQWMLLLKRGAVAFNPLQWNWRKTVAAMLLAFVIVWAGYFCHVSHLSIHDENLTATFPHWNERIEKSIQSRWNLDLLVPAGEYIEGFREVARHNRHGQRSYFLGQVSATGGWKLYYPSTILLKWPTMVLILAVAGFVMTAARRIPVASDLWIMASFPFIYFVLAVFAHFNIGERHVLPLYPFALMFAGLTWQKISRHRFGLAIMIALVLLNAADALRFAPDYLSYFSPATHSYESYRLLSDSNLDWGQGLLAVREYEQEHPQEQPWLAYFGSVDPAVYGLRSRPLGEKDHVTGTVMVSATNLSGQFLQNPESYRWLMQYPRTELLNHSIYVFKVPPGAAK